MDKANKIVLSIRQEKDPFERFIKVRNYLDASVIDDIDIDLLGELLNDEYEFTRSDVADFILIHGGLPFDIIARRLDEEFSNLVQPRLWLALAISDSDSAIPLLKTINVGDLSMFERSYYDAAMLCACGDPFYLYDLCALACSNDIPSSHSAIDLLQITAGDRTLLLQELVMDLDRKQADNAAKAHRVLDPGESKYPTPPA